MKRASNGHPVYEPRQQDCARSQRAMGQLDIAANHVQNSAYGKIQYVDADQYWLNLGPNEPIKKVPKSFNLQKDIELIAGDHVKVLMIKNEPHSVSVVVIVYLVLIINSYSVIAHLKGSRPKGTHTN